LIFPGLRYNASCACACVFVIDVYEGDTHSAVYR
jgi:hypothetical protein